MQDTHHSTTVTRSSGNDAVFPRDGRSGSTALSKPWAWIGLCSFVFLAFLACCPAEETSDLEGAPSETRFPHLTAARLKLQQKKAALRVASMAASFVKIHSTAQPREEHGTAEDAAEVLGWAEEKRREAENEVNEAREQLDRSVHLSKENMAIRCREYSGLKSDAWKKCEDEIENLALVAGGHSEDLQASFIQTSYGLNGLRTKVNIDLSNCKSEGGSINCADCTHPDSLCRQVYANLSSYDSEHTDFSPCTDTYPNPFADMKVFVMWRRRKDPNPRRYCRAFSRTQNMEFGFKSDNFFMLDNATNSPYMITKLMMGHPNRADQNVGGIGIKRVLMHQHSATGEWVADVYKETYCIKCPSPMAVVSRGKPTTQSSSIHGGVAARATDGNTDGNYGGNSCTHTNEGETSPWWRVDLQTVQSVHEVKLFNRASFGDRLVGFEVRVGNDDTTAASNTLCGGSNSNPGASITVQCNKNGGISGQYVFVTIPGSSKTLTLCEVEVMAPETFIFHSKYASQQNTSEIEAFETCAQSAFEHDGTHTNLMDSHQCNTLDYKHFKLMAITF